MSEEKMRKAFQPLREACESGKIGAAVGLIARDGQVVLLEATGMMGANEPMRIDAIHRLASIAKLATAAVVMQLYEKGLLDLHDPVSNYLPEYENAKLKMTDGADMVKKPMTIFHLLTHQSGLASNGNKFWAVWDKDGALSSFTSNKISQRYISSLAGINTNPKNL